MKKIFTLMVAALAALAVTSCNKEEMAGASNEATMTLSVNLAEGVQTKAYGDGMYADKNLIIGVFDENGTEKFRQNLVWEKDKFTDEISIRFIMGKKYQIVLWAQYGNAYGDPKTMPLDKITLDYAASNGESLDAFYAYVPVFEVKQDFNKSVTLTRPFAQLNFATTVGDIEESIKDDFLGLPGKAVVTVKNLANTLDLFTGKTTYVNEKNEEFVDGVSVVIPETDFPMVDGKLQTIKIEDVVYEVIAMNYLLIADTNSKDGKVTADLTLEVGDLVINVPQAPLQRNWKTNVYGELLTAEGTFNVTINPNPLGSYNHDWNNGTNQVIPN